MNAWKNALLILVGFVLIGTTLASDNENCQVQINQCALILDQWEKYMVTVDYGKSFKEMIRGGNYEMICSGVTEDHFPIGGTGLKRVEIILVPLGDISEFTDDPHEFGFIKSELKKRYDLRPAKIEELLALGEQFPKIQQEHQIPALGTIYQKSSNSHWAACLNTICGRRELGMEMSECVNSWSKNCCIAAVRKGI